MKSHYEVADELCGIDGVSDVRASRRQLTIAVAPNEKCVEKLPEDVAEKIADVIVDTLWQPDYNDFQSVEKHSWSGGVFNNPVLRSAKQPEGYELQLHLVK